MDYRKLGRSGLKVSPICLGTMMFGVQTSEADSRRIIDKARDTGINFIDTADVYGAGVSEEVTGRGVAGSRVSGILISPDAAGPDHDEAALTDAVQIGKLIKVFTPRSVAFGVVSSLEVRNPSSPPSSADARILEIELFGEAISTDSDGEGGFVFQRGVSVYPGLGQTIYATTTGDLARIYARPDASNIRIGSLYQDDTLPAYAVTDDLLGKHFAVLGSTGTGKSCAVALILRSILGQHGNGHVLLLDLHNKLLFPVVESYRGTLVKTIGDSIMASFRSPRAAVEAATAAAKGSASCTEAAVAPLGHGVVDGDVGDAHRAGLHEEGPAGVVGIERVAAADDLQVARDHRQRLGQRDVAGEDEPVGARRVVGAEDGGAKLRFIRDVEVGRSDRLAGCREQGTGTQQSDDAARLLPQPRPSRV